MVQNPSLDTTRYSLSQTRPGLSRPHGLVLALLLAMSLAACQSGGDGGGDEAANGPPVVEITAADYAFAAPDTIPAGWVTFRMKNRGEESHHFQLRRLPEGRTFADWQEGIMAPTDSIWGLVAEGKMDSSEAGTALEQVYPDWADRIETRGGVAPVAAGRTGQATQHVDPGHYVMTCILGAPDGRAHAFLGMVDELVVADSSLEDSLPTPGTRVRATGPTLHVEPPLASGRQTVGFQVDEIPEGLPEESDGSYGVILARLGDTTSAREAAAWDFQNPPPYESLGGFEFISPDRTAYITADVEPGRYAWLWFYEGLEGGPIAKAFTVE